MVRSLFRRVRSIWSRFLLFIAFLGPGVITGNVDNDAGGLTTYSVIGARYGYQMLWVLIPATVALAVIQEMAARMGTVTGKGLADLIRERFGLRTTVFAMLLLVFGNLATTISEFAGVAAASEILGIPKYLAVPSVAFLVWTLVLHGSYRIVERAFLVLSTVYFSYVAAGLMAKPVWKDVFYALVRPQLEPELEFVVLLIATLGTTITPWMQFYHQAMVVDKGVTVSNYRYVRLDTYLGAFMTDFVSFFIIVSCGTVLFPHGIRIESADQAALALVPFAGRFAAVLFAVGMLNASTMAASVLPLSTSYAVAEAFGWEAAIGRRFHEAPLFLGLYTALIVIGASVIMLPRLNLIRIFLFSQTVNGVLLPFILYYMLTLVNDKRIMGDYTNTPVTNFIAWVTALGLVALTVAMLVLTFP